MGIEYKYDQKILRDVEKKLGDMSSKAQQVLKKAINMTAKKARSTIAKKAQEEYAVKTGKFNKAMRIKNATNGNLEATITAKGKVMELKDFRVSPATVKNGTERPKIVKAKVLKSGSMKRLEKGGIKAFVVKFKSGHTTVAQRETNERLPVKVLYSPSIPKMIGDEKRVYRKVRPVIRSELKKNVDAQIKKLLNS